MYFELHERLQEDCFDLGKLDLCRLLLMNDQRYPWFILVPQRPDISEIYQLTPADQQQLIQESSLLSRQLADLYHADKMNIAALGNIVPQLHIHHVVRTVNDAAWPAPIWGMGDAIAYTADQVAEIQGQIQSKLKLHSLSI